MSDAFFPTAEVFNRVLRVSGLSEGTGVLVDIDKRQYLVTAAHVAGSVETRSLSIFHDDKWNSYEVSVLGLDAVYDVAVLRLPFLIDRRDLSLPVHSGGIIWGQTVFFLGYPFGEYGIAEVFGHGKLPLPFVKRACLSMFGTLGRPQTIVLDGINNIGFSGGPIIFQENGKPKLAGIVTGLREEERLLSYAFREGNVEDVVKGKAEKVVYAQNTGLIYGAGSKVIIDLIAMNPIGVVIPS